MYAEGKMEGCMLVSVDAISSGSVAQLAADSHPNHFTLLSALGAISKICITAIPLGCLDSILAWGLQVYSATQPWQGSNACTQLLVAIRRMCAVIVVCLLTDHMRQKYSLECIFCLYCTVICRFFI